MKIIISFILGGLLSAGLMYAYLPEKIEVEKERKGMTNKQIIEKTNLCRKDGLGAIASTYKFGGGVASVDCVPTNECFCD